MTDEDKGGEQLLDELRAVRQRVAELEAGESRRQRARGAIVRGGIWPLVACAFVLLCVMVWLTEILDIPHFLLGAPLTPINWREAVVETVAIVIVGIFAVSMLIRDISERKRAEEALQESEKKHRVLFEMAQDAIFLNDETGRFVDVNRAACELLGYSRGELLELSIKEIDADPRGYKAFLKVRDGLAKTMTFEVNQRRKDGTLLPVEVTGSFLTGGSQRIFLAIARDITERKRAEETLRHAHEELAAEAVALKTANAELDQYAHVVSHDMRAPLRAIRNYADFIREDLAATLDKEVKVYLDGLSDAVNEADALAQDLLALSRVGQQSVAVETVDMGAFLRELIPVLGVPDDVEIVMPDDWPTIEVEPVLLKQICLNVISNAIKFNRSPHKRVELGWQSLATNLTGSEKSTKSYEFFVRDNGIGIAPRHQQQIFGVFERLHVSGEYEGTGIGLAIVKKAVDKLGGSVRVESQLGEGSTFFVTLSIFD